MKKLWNVDHQHAILDADTSVAPGEAHEFTDEQIKNGITGSWSDKNPRAGRKAEREFKKRRDSKAAQPSPPQDAADDAAAPDPAEPGEKKE